MSGWYLGAGDENTDWLILCKKYFGDVYPLPVEMCIPFDLVVFQESSQQRYLHNYSKVIQKETNI